MITKDCNMSTPALSPKTESQYAQAFVGQILASLNKSNEKLADTIERVDKAIDIFRPYKDRPDFKPDFALLTQEVEKARNVLNLRAARATPPEPTVEKVQSVRDRYAPTEFKMSLFRKERTVYFGNI